MRRKSKKNRRKARSSVSLGTSRPIRVAAPEVRLEALFKLVDDVTRSAERAVTQTIDTGEPLLLFDLSIFNRGLNALKSIRILTAQGHWENAAGICRQLFELVVNMEHVGRQPDREAAAFTFAKFGLLQMAQLQLLQSDYDRKTGRPVDEERTQSLREFVANAFPEFRAKDRSDGSKRFVPSWSRKTTRELAEASDHRLRSDQYQLLFGPWSEQTHAAPAALLVSSDKRQVGSGAD